MSRFIDTVISDLHAGVSWLEAEVETAALDVWNVIKVPLVALEPAAGAILLDAVKVGVAAASAGQTIEQIETAIMNTTEQELLAALKQAGSGVVQALIALAKASGIAQ